MSYKLMLIEAPGKVKTIQKYLGNDYKVIGSKGHVTELVKGGGTKFGIDLDAMTGIYRISPDKAGIVKDIKAAMANASEVIIATDLDREGEAIGWQLLEALKVPDNMYSRIRYNEITKESIHEALNNKDKINMDLVNAQQGRRFLDRLIGFELSPFLWKSIEKGLSAGRVQSVVVKMIVEREREIRNFVPDEYWNITVDTEKENKPLTLALKKIDNNKAEVKNKEESEDIKTKLESATISVSSVIKKPKNQNPTAPFINSAFQAGCASQLKMTPQRSMAIAQILYEKGLITYHRTDAKFISTVFQQTTLNFIKSEYGDKYAPRIPNTYKSKGNAQEAHEAIRPTSLGGQHKPDSIKSVIEAAGVSSADALDAVRAYKLIYNKYISSQMAPAIFDTTSIVTHAVDGEWNAELRANGRIQKFDGFLKVYSENDDEKGINSKVDEDLNQNNLPDVSKGDELNAKKVNTVQKFTSPPPRLTMTSIVTEMEKKEIGRPATTAGIISTIQKRKYVQLVKGKFEPTPLGEKVTGTLQKDFSDILDYDFTKGMENDLDKICSGEINYVKYLKDFWGPFHTKTDNLLEKFKAVVSPFEGKCPVCGAGLIKVKSGEREWVQCETRQDKKCKFTRNVEVTINEDKKCPKCNNDLYLKKARTTGDEFWACATYPVCKYSEPKDGVKIHPTKKCEKCQGDLTERKGRNGAFWSCSNYPECKFILSEKKIHPTKKCEKCQGDLVEKYSVARKSHFWGCDNYPECKFILSDGKQKTGKRPARKTRKRAGS